MKNLQAYTIHSPLVLSSSGGFMLMIQRVTLKNPEIII